MEDLYLVSTSFFTAAYSVCVCVCVQVCVVLSLTCKDILIGVGVSSLYKSIKRSDRGFKFKVSSLFEQSQT